MNIRLAKLGDARGIAELMCSIDDYPHWKAHGADAFERYVTHSLEAANDQRLVFVAVLDQRVVGYAAVYWLQPFFQPFEGYLHELFVRSDVSGQGIGTALLETVKDAATARGCVRLTLVNGKDTESYKRGFYAKKGWRERSETIRFDLNLEVKQ